jgi:hypothetical protein
MDRRGNHRTTRLFSDANCLSNWKQYRSEIRKRFETSPKRSNFDSEFTRILSPTRRVGATSVASFSSASLLKDYVVARSPLKSTMSLANL